MMNTRDHGGGVYGINMDCSIVCVCVEMTLLNLIH